MFYLSMGPFMIKPEIIHNTILCTEAAYSINSECFNREISLAISNDIL